MHTRTLHHIPKPNFTSLLFFIPISTCLHILMAKFGYIWSLFILLLVLDAITPTLCHTKGLQPKRNTWKQLGANLTQTQYSEQQFMKWVNFVGSLKHSLFSPAKNKLFPSYMITVDKNPARGDFTTIQQAIDSLPFVNLIRVVIKVHAGVYK